MTRPRSTYAVLAFVLLAIVNLIACQKFSKIEAGKEVTIAYKLTVDGQIVDSSEGKEPLTFVQGTGQIIPGLDKELLGLKVGEKKLVTVAPENGYGPLDPKAKQKVPLKSFGNTKDLKVGMVVNGQAQDGRPIQAKVLEIGKKDVLLDFNHPLAGKTLNFDIEVIAIAAAPKPQAPAAGPAN